MTIEKRINDTEMTLVLKGRLDTVSAPQLEKEIKQEIGNIKTLIFDFESLEYLSSAGLRVVLMSQKIMNKQGRMVVRNVNDTIHEIFEMTGFLGILTLE